jgi:hypothetical protein
MGFTRITGFSAHDVAMTAAEGVRQSASATTMATARTADITFHRAGLASALANGIQPGPWMNALRELGVNGV